MNEYRRTWAKVPTKPRRARAWQGIDALGYQNLPPEKECPECGRPGGRHEEWCGVKAKERRSKYANEARSKSAGD